MADPSGLDDLEAELRRMEEELAALQGKGGKKQRGKEPAPSAEGAAQAPAEGAAPPEPAAKRKLGGLFGRKAREDVAPRDVVPVPAPPEERVLGGMTPAPIAAPLADTLPVVAQPLFLAASGRWRQEGRAWVLRGDAEPQVLRRVLDSDGRLVSEEPATRDLLAAAPEPRDAEAAPAAPPAAAPEPSERPLHALAERLGQRKEKQKQRKGLFGRKKGDA